MDNDILYGIVAAIREEFEHPVYVDPLEQGFQAPCFFVQPVSTSRERVRGPWHRQENEYVIQYFPGTSQVHEEMSDAAERLFECLELIIVLNKVVYAAGLRAEPREEALNFYAGYPVFLRAGGAHGDEMESVTCDIVQRKE
ncbi:hypothetical protein MUB23_04035 [Cuneatibacter sp. NSJ-177]|uniref:phage tail terminator family protein n=1 Tax=Cuneatibacter sp. NSJ-177 TaxID=2931401 RepID=UPI001FD59AF4|nr:hypothetical protein [Cuneatibacter sp. NSJ-177]MCJ7834564.1 hypothetical protein [Cuneatibacter sp. NSJ-177]